MCSGSGRSIQNGQPACDQAMDPVLWFKIELPIGHADEIGFNRDRMLNLHALLSHNRPSHAVVRSVACRHQDTADINAAVNSVASGIGATGHGGGDSGHPEKRHS